jgi:hypothetical protein
VFPVAPVAALILSLSSGRMSPADSVHLERLTTLEARYLLCPEDIDNAVGYAHTLHDLRRDKPALLVMTALPMESLGPEERLFTASMRLFDSDVPGAFATAVPVCLPALAVMIVGSLPMVILLVSDRRSGGDA